ncbi:MAG: polysaccharide deacetylase family protein [Verrucomicrobiota bacterium]
MRIKIRSTIIAAAILSALALGFLGAWRFYHKQQVLSALPMRVPILMYHDLSASQDSPIARDVWTVQAGNFAKHLQSLRAQGYTSIQPCDLTAALQGRKKLPRKPVIITFDDGLLSSMTLAEPLLKHYGFQAIVYLITARIADSPEQRQFYRDAPCLAWAEVRAMFRRGTLTFGIHSHTHSKQLADTAAEMQVSRDLFRARTGRSPDSFCYPYGQTDANLIESARAAGYTTAMICNDEVAVLERDTDLLALPRVSVFGGVQDFAVQDLPPEQTGPAAVGRIVRNTGRPLPVAPRLLGTGLPEEKTWLAETRLGPEPQEWRWVLDPGADLNKLRLEIWDRNRILLLFTVP